MGLRHCDLNELWPVERPSKAVESKLSGRNDGISCGTDSCDFEPTFKPTTTVRKKIRRVLEGSPAGTTPTVRAVHGWKSQWNKWVPSGKWVVIDGWCPSYCRPVNEHQESASCAAVGSFLLFLYKYIQFYFTNIYIFISPSDGSNTHTLKKTRNN